MKVSVWSNYICGQNMQRTLKETSDSELNKDCLKHSAKLSLGKKCGLRIKPWILVCLHTIISSEK